MAITVVKLFLKPMKMGFRLFTLVALITMLLETENICGQNQNIDSLKSLLVGKNDGEKINIFFEMARLYQDEGYDQGLVYANQGYALAVREADSLGMVKLGRLRAQLLRRLSKIDSAIILLNHILPIARRNNYSDELFKILNSMGTANLHVSKFDKALVCFFEGLRYSEKNKDHFFSSVIANNIGLVYFQLEDYGKAVAYYKRSLDQRSLANDRDMSELTLLNISLCYIFMREYSLAQQFRDNVLKNCGNGCSKTVLLSASYNTGLIEFYRNNLDQAERELIKSYKLSEEIGDERYLLDNITYLLKISGMKGMFKNGDTYIDIAERLIDSGFPYNTELETFYSEVINFYRQSGNKTALASFQDRFITLKDHVFNDELTANLMRVEAEELSSDYREKIAAQDEILQLKDDVIIVHKTLNLLTGIVTISLIALVLILFRSNRQKQKINLLLDKKVRERTQQLEQNRDILQQACDDRDNLIRKTSMDINNSLATLKGLCALGLKDVEDEQALLYISKMNATSDSFSEIVSRLRVHRNPSMDPPIF